MPSLLNRAFSIEASSASDLVPKKPAETRHKPLRLLNWGRMPTVRYKFEGSALETGNRLLRLGVWEYPIMCSPHDERWSLQFRKPIHPHLALSFKSYLGTNGGQLGLQKPRHPRQPVLLLKPLPRHTPGTRKKERRAAQGPLSRPWAPLAPSDRQLAVAGQR